MITPEEKLEYLKTYMHRAIEIKAEEYKERDSFLALLKLGILPIDNNTGAVTNVPFEDYIKTKI